MRYCKKCTMPDTRPGITFDSEGVCSACRHYENRKNVDWDARFKEFEAYCDKYRGMNGPGGASNSMIQAEPSRIAVKITSLPLLV